MPWGRCAPATSPATASSAKRKNEVAAEVYHTGIWGAHFEGMSFHFMPALWTEDWGLEITEPLLVREDGPAECLADYPRKLLVKP